MSTWRNDKQYYLLCLLLIALSYIDLVHSRGGGSKRTFGSPKSQNSPNQQAVDCNSDQQQPCANEQSDSSWSSAFGATMALIGPLLVLLTLIIMIKFCFYNSYPKGQFGSKQDQAPLQQPQRQQQQEQQFGCSSSLKIGASLDNNNNNINALHHPQHDDKQVAATIGGLACICVHEHNDTPTKPESCSCHACSYAKSSGAPIIDMITTMGSI